MTTKLEVVASALQEIYSRRGQLTPEDVVTEAASPQSSLHDFFTWDDSDAADRWRLGEARGLIRSVRVLVTTENETYQVRSWLAARDSGSERQGYVPEAEVRLNPVARETQLRTMRREWVSCRRRWEHLQEFWTMVGAEHPEMGEGAVG